MAETAEGPEALREWIQKSHLSWEALGWPRSVWDLSGKEGQQVLNPEWLREQESG